MEICQIISKKLGLDKALGDPAEDDILGFIAGLRNDIPDYEQMKRDGVLKIKMQEPTVSFKEQIEDPENNPFPTLSGKIEIFCEHIQEMDNPLIPAIPKYLTHAENYDSPLTAKYPKA